MKKLTEILGLGNLSTTYPQTEHMSGYVDGFNFATNHINKFEIDYEVILRLFFKSVGMNFDNFPNEEKERYLISCKSYIPPEKLFKKKVG